VERGQLDWCRPANGSATTTSGAHLRSSAFVELQRLFTGRRWPILLRTTLTDDLG
jgi:hypothetical protein